MLGSFALGRQGTGHARDEARPAPARARLVRGLHRGADRDRRHPDRAAGQQLEPGPAGAPRRQEYARQLHAELQSDLRNIVSTRKFWKKVSDYQAVASLHAETGALAEGSAWKTVLAYYQASQLRPFELEDTTFTELRYAGELRLLGDTGLSKGLADYYRQTGSGMIGEILRHARLPGSRSAA
jgi:hypothetical protein